jgi:formate hydrogenlyase subunit 4
MIDFLNQYFNEIKRRIGSGKKQNWKVVLKNHREVIKFMQHERLIHLLVTLVFGIVFIISMMFSLIYQFVFLKVIDLLLLVLLVPYIFHYFKLENGVQKMYWIDKLIQSKLEISDDHD